MYQATNAVAGHEPGKILTGDAQVSIGLRADGVDDCVVQPSELLVRDRPTDLDVAEEPKPLLGRQSARMRATPT